MIEVDALDIGYPGRRVVAGASFAVRAGEVLCVLGANGSGKTTLLRTLLGLQPRLGGRIAVDGTPIERLERREIARHIAYVPQEHDFAFAYAVEDVVLMGRSPHVGAFAGPRRADRDGVARALDALGIGGLARASFAELSGGERQLVLVARALAQEANLLVMDEPTAGLDLANQATVLERTRRLASGGSAIVFSSHDPAHAGLVADRALLLGGGSVMALGPPHDVLDAPAVERLYGVPVDVCRNAEGSTAFLPRLQPGS